MEIVGARRWPRGAAAMGHVTALAFVVLASIPAARRGAALDAPVRVAGGLVSGVPGP